MSPKPTPDLSDASTIAASPEQTSADMPGETVILHPKSGRYYGLDNVGARVWQLVQSPRTFGEIRQIIADEYDVDPARSERDLRQLVGELSEAGLVSVGDEGDR